MLGEIKQLVRKDPRVQLILLFGLIIQVITSITAIGFYHPDQHFSVIEFSSYQLGEENGADAVWEFENFVRQTIQVYLFSAYHLALKFLGIGDGYLQLTILRIIQSVVVWAVFNLLAIHYFKTERTKVLYSVLLILNFSWWYPYVRTLFCSEILSSVFFFGTIFLYDLKKDKNPGFIFLALIGFLLCLSFFLRFQMGFAIAGFGIWMLVFEKKYSRILPMAFGFLICFIINLSLDSKFYEEIVIIPYNYFHANIIGGRASSFGTSSFLRYIGLLILTITAPPFSIILFYYAIKAIFKKYNHPVIISTILFIVAHCMVGHKEERFLFPVFNILPVIVGWGLPDLLKFYENCRKAIRYFLKVLLIITVGLNMFVLIVMSLTPYSQTVYFTYLLKGYFKNNSASLYCLDRTPFETISKVPLVYYRRESPNLNLIRIKNNDSARHLTGENIFIATTFNQIKNDQGLLDSLGYKPVIYSSKLLWNIDEFLHSKKLPPIDDIWVLYKRNGK